MTDLQRCSCFCGCVVPLTTTDANKGRYTTCFMCENDIHEGTDARKAIVTAQTEIKSWRKAT